MHLMPELKIHETKRLISFKMKNRQMGVKYLTTFILTAITGSLVHVAGWTVLPRPATVSDPRHKLNSLGSRSQSPFAPCSTCGLPSSLLLGLGLILQEHWDSMAFFLLSQPFQASCSHALGATLWIGPW